MFKKYLIWSSISFFIAGLLILLFCLGVLPFNLTIFGVVGGLLCLISYFYPREIFWLFLVLSPLEIIILSPTQIPFSLRPFQLTGGILIAIVLLLWWQKKIESSAKFNLLSFKKKQAREKERSFSWCDCLVFLFPIVALFGLFNATDQVVALKLNIVFFSFLGIYWLTRNFIQTKQDLLESLWFFLVGLSVVTLFVFYQMLAARNGWPDFQVMAGRANGTFTEPDWLGIYLALSLAIIFWLKLYSKEGDSKLMAARVSWHFFYSSVTNILIFLTFLTLILTVARSAWLGAVAVGIGYLFLSLLTGEGWLKVAKRGLSVIVLATLAFGLAFGAGLSGFHFGNRAASSVSGMQKITVSCVSGKVAPEEIRDVAELTEYNCRHINLEEIEKEQLAGNFIQEVYRPDPNVEIRKNIYSLVWRAIKQKPLFGYGLAAAGELLGKDERGSSLNASNIFLEVWLTTGLIGLVLLLIVIFAPFFVSGRLFWRKRDNKSYLVFSFVLLSTLAVVVPNLFNSGLFLAFFWIWLAIVVGLISQENNFY